MQRLRAQRGFTLVELLVVIGILGVLVTVLAVTVLPKIIGAKTDLDAKQLSGFRTELVLILADNDKTKLLREISPKKGKGRAVDLFYEMWVAKLITTDTFGLLAGASGKAADEGTLKSNSVNTTDHVIFTTAPTGDKFIKLLKGKPSSGAAMCYNYNKLADVEEMVILFAGENTATAMGVYEIEKKFNDNADKPIEFKGELKEMGEKIYGKDPFKEMAKE